MLINKGAAVDEIVTIRTTAGEEIVGKLVEDNEKFLVLNRPRALVSTAKGATLAPFIFTSDSETIAFAKHAILVGPLATVKDAADLYTQTTTGIALAN
jgi:hypothetical protein